MRHQMPVVASAVVLGSLALIGTMKHVRAASAPPIDYVTIIATYSAHTLLAPAGVYVNPNTPNILYISDTGHNQIDQYSSGSLEVIAGNGTAGLVDGTLTTAKFKLPTGLSGRGSYEVVGSQGPAYVVTQLLVQDSGNNAVREICQVAEIGPPTGGPGCFTPSGVKTVAGNGAAGFVNGTGSTVRMSVPTFSAQPILSGFFADVRNNVIRTLTPPTGTGTTATVTSPTTSTTTGLVNGALSSARFNGPVAIVAGPSGAYFVSDTGNYVIRKVNSSNNVTTFSGSGIQGYQNGGPTVARFASPAGSVVYSANNYLYVADSLNNCIRQVDTNGNVTTYSGTNESGHVDGTLQAARYANPTSLAISGSTMYVADTNNNAIREINMTTGQVITLID